MTGQFARFRTLQTAYEKVCSEADRVTLCHKALRDAVQDYEAALSVLCSIRSDFDRSCLDIVAAFQPAPPIPPTVARAIRLNDELISAAMPAARPPTVTESS